MEVRCERRVWENWRFICFHTPFHFLHWDAERRWSSVFFISIIIFTLYFVDYFSSFISIDCFFINYAISFLSYFSFFFFFFFLSFLLLFFFFFIFVFHNIRYLPFPCRGIFNGYFHSSASSYISEMYFFRVIIIRAFFLETLRRCLCRIFEIISSITPIVFSPDAILRYFLLHDAFSFRYCIFRYYVIMVLIIFRLVYWMVFRYRDYRRWYFLPVWW